MEHIIAFRITREEKELIKAYAKKRGISVSPFCRFIILNKIHSEKEAVSNA